MSAAQHLPRFAPLRMVHPFRRGNALLFSLVTGVILTAIVLIDDLRFSPVAPLSSWHMVFTLCHLLLLCCLLFLYNFRLFDGLTGAAAGSGQPTRTFTLAVAGSLAATAAFSLLSSWAAGLLKPALGVDVRVDLGLSRDGFVALTVVLVTVLLYNLTRHQQRLLDEERTRSESVQTRYEALEKQIDPHFLFNSLNTLDGLIGYDDGKAHDYLQRLAGSYRYIMQQRRLVTLEEELAFTDNFIAMMQIRYGDSFGVVRHVDPKCLGAQVVPISVQLLVENALQHNVASRNHPLRVTIEAGYGTGQDKSLCLTVRNPLQPKGDWEPDQHGSIGLKNLSGRCMLTMHRDIAIRQRDGWFEVEIPLAAEPQEGKNTIR